MTVYTKIINYDDANQGKISLEVELQKIAAKYDFAPKVYDINYYDGHAIFSMENLNEMCLADKYGENPEDIPKKYWDQIRNILSTLLDEEGIVYIDITPYNFIEKNDKVYIIDFGHAYYHHSSKKLNWFLQDVLDGHNGWNPDFK